MQLLVHPSPHRQKDRQFFLVGLKGRLVLEEKRRNGLASDVDEEEDHDHSGYVLQLPWIRDVKVLTTFLSKRQR